MSKLTDAALWFKKTFGPQIRPAIDGTPFSVDLLTAIAIQETYEIWGRIYQSLTPDEVLQLCVGDVIGEPRRGVFPKTKADLLAAPRGNEMFDIAHQSLIALAAHATEYQKYADNPDRFCHAFGIFQYDIQFFRDDPEFFLQRKWFSFDECVARCVRELRRVTAKTFGKDKSTLNEIESVYVAIGYNSGSVNITAGLKQGFKDDTGKYYGEYVADYLRTAQQAIVT